jgi:hypothetical protein
MASERLLKQLCVHHDNDLIICKKNPQRKPGIKALN